MVVLAGSEQLLDQALERADGDERLSEDDFDAALEGLPDEALARVYAEPAGADRLRSADGRGGPQGQVGGCAAHAGAHGHGERRRRARCEFNVRTDPEGLTRRRPADGRGRRVAAGALPPRRDRLRPARPGQVIKFAEAAGQSIDPSGFGDYEQAKQTLDSRLEIDIDDDLIGQLTRRHVGQRLARRQVRRAGRARRTPAPSSRRWPRSPRVLPDFARGRRPGRGAGRASRAAAIPSTRSRRPDGDGWCSAWSTACSWWPTTRERAASSREAEPETVDGAEGPSAERRTRRSWSTR